MQRQHLLSGSIQAPTSAKKEEEKHEHEHDHDHETRERCASRASAAVYGMSHDPSDDENDERGRLSPGGRPRRSTSPRRMRRTISGERAVRRFELCYEF